MWPFSRPVAPPVAARHEPRLTGPGATGSAMAPRQGRAWLGAAPSRLLADLPSGAAAAPNREIHFALSVLRARSRWLSQNDGYTAGFLKALRRNVTGPSGFTLQMRVKNDRGDGQDKGANALIEAAWADWCRAGSCDVTGRLSFADFCRLVITGVARDGEALIRRHRSNRFSRYGFALEVLEPSQLDETINGRPPGCAAANIVRMGVELDPFGRPAAYHIRIAPPNDDPGATIRGAHRVLRVPADEILHLFMSDWPGQVRGVPWVAPAIRTLAMRDGYAEAELTAARVSANKMGFYKFNGEEEPDGELASDGTLVQQAEAGTFELLPKGIDFQGFDPQHPNAGFADFIRSVLRSSAASVGLSYNAFANDADGMNYSALRATELEDRDEFRTIQAWMIGSFAEPIFAAWLTESLLTGAIGLPASKAFKFTAPQFLARGWDWVDPLKEVAAVEKAIALGLTSRTAQIASRGGDIEQVAADLKAEAELFQGIIPPAGAAAPLPPDQGN
jgi:lambda family phage portal protein